MERRREVRGQVLHHDTQLATPDFSMGDQFGQNLPDSGRGDSEAKADADASRTDDGAIDTNYASLEIEQRAAGITRIDGSVSLDVAFERVRLRTSSAECADDAMRHGMAQTEWVAYRDHIVADMKASRIPDRQLRETAGIDLDDRDIGFVIGSENPSLEAAPVGKRDRDLLRALNDMVVGEDQAPCCVDDGA